jgi:hypothetical protein
MDRMPWVLERHVGILRVRYSCKACVINPQHECETAQPGDQTTGKANEAYEPILWTRNLSFLEEFV